MHELFDGMIMGVSGARGLLGSALTPEVASRLGAAFGLMFGKGSYLVARDSRPSGTGLAEAAAAGLASVGCEPIMTGVVTTPGAQILVGEGGNKGGIVITASHNPAEWNGLKFIAKDETFLTQREAERLYDIARDTSRSGNGIWSWSPRRVISTGSRTHIERIVSSPLVDVKAIRDRRFSVVVDCNHGAAGPLFRELGAYLDLELLILGEEPTGLFTHVPEPAPVNLTDFGTAVKETSADLGAALDPDGDRLVLCTADGRILPEEATLPLVARAVLARENGPVVTNLSTSRMIDDVVAAVDAALFRAPVGEAHVVGAMKENNAVIGGEGNGGVIIPSIHLGRDGAAGLSVLLTFLAEQQETIASMWSAMPRYSMIKRKAPAAGVDWRRLSDHVVERYRSCEATQVDGLRLDGDGWWLHIRPSNTEPVIRIIAEGSDQNQVEDLVKSIIDLLAQNVNERGG